MAVIHLSILACPLNGATDRAIESALLLAIPLLGTIPSVE